MKTIGIKLADGSFYPVLEEGKPSEKTLNLTTAHNNQTKIMVDLYRSADCSMEDAEYVDSLQFFHNPININSSGVTRGVASGNKVNNLEDAKRIVEGMFKF